MKLLYTLLFIICTQVVFAQDSTSVYKQALKHHSYVLDNAYNLSPTEIDYYASEITETLDYVNAPKSIAKVKYLAGLALYQKIKIHKHRRSLDAIGYKKTLEQVVSYLSYAQSQNIGHTVQGRLTLQEAKKLLLETS